MNYQVINEDNVWKVIELSSEQVIKVFRYQAEANHLKESLNNGAGFQGDTPSFILQEMEIPK